MVQDFAFKHIIDVLVHAQLKLSQLAEASKSPKLTRGFLKQLWTHWVVTGNRTSFVVIGEGLVFIIKHNFAHNFAFKNSTKTEQIKNVRFKEFGAKFSYLNVTHCS